jgi:hypothetical protein
VFSVGELVATVQRHGAGCRELVTVSERLLKAACEVMSVQVAAAVRSSVICASPAQGLGERADLLE